MLDAISSRGMDEPRPSERERLLTRFGRQFVAGEVIFRGGEPGGEAFLLQQGRVRLLKRVRTVERSLLVLRPGELFGEAALLPGTVRTSTAVALSDGSALAVDQGTFHHLLANNPGVAARMVHQLVRRLRDAEDQIELMLLPEPQSKIVAALLKAAQQATTDQARSDGALLVSVSPLELATRVGLDIDTVKQGVQRLREGNYVRIVDERLEIPDVDALRRLYALLGVKDHIQGRDVMAGTSAEEGTLRSGRV